MALTQNQAIASMAINAILNNPNTLLPEVTPIKETRLIQTVNRHGVTVFKESWHQEDREED